MNYRKDLGYMSVEAINDVNNTFLSRRELTCNFAGLGGKLKKLEAIEMVTKEFKLDGKIVIPIKMKNHTGRPVITGTFYVYDDEKLAKEHINPVIFKRLEKAKTPKEKPEAKETAKEKPSESKEDSTESKPAEEKKESKPAEEKKESKPAEEKNK